MAVGGSEDAILFSKLWLDECIFKEKEKLRCLFQHPCAALPLSPSGRGCLGRFGSAVFAEARLMGETFDCTNWFSVKGKVGSGLGQQSSNLGDGGAAHCG